MKQELTNTQFEPVRKIGKSHTSLTGRVSNSNEESLNALESSLQWDFINLTNFNPNVERFVEQPVTIEYFDLEGIGRTYTPDFIVFYKNNGLIPDITPTLIEIKYRDEIKKSWSVLKPKFLAAMKYCDKKGWKFKILTEREIRTDYLFNARFLKPYENSSFINIEDVAAIMGKLKDLDETTARELIPLLTSDERKRGHYLYTLWHMVAVHLVNADLSRRLNMNSTIWTKV